MSDREGEPLHERYARYLHLAAEADREADRAKEQADKIYLRSIATSWRLLAKEIKNRERLSS